MSQLPPQGPPSAQPPAQPPAPPAGAPPATPPPAYVPPPPPPNFKSGKKKTIGMIVAGVVGAGLLGGIVGLTLGGGDDDSSPAAGSDGNGSGILNPTPVGSVDQPPEPDGENPAEPDPAEPDIPDVPAPVDEPADTGGDMVTIGAVLIPVPDGWEVQGDPGDYDVNLAGEDGTWVYALTGTVDPTSDAGSVLSGTLDSLVPSDNYSQLELSAIEPLDPFGSVVSGAVMDYSGLWVDTQGSTPVSGRIYAAIRQDGTALLMSFEHSPPDEFDSSMATWGPLLEETFSLFGSN
jgi:hypothetical protein